MSNSVRPHRRQPTRLPCPWASPGKNTGVGCHFLLQCMKVKSTSEVAQSCPTLSNPMDCSPPGSSVHGLLQARILEWVAISLFRVVFSLKALCHSTLHFSVTLSTTVCPFPSLLTLYTSKLSMTASKQVYRSLSRVTTWKKRESTRGEA